MRQALRTTLLVLSLALIACARRAGTGKGELLYGLTLAPSSIDPHVGASSELGIPLTSVYDPLVWLTPQGEFVPGLADRWETSADGTVYTLYLRSDVTFHDDTPFNAEAVCVNLERIADPETRSAKARSLLGPFESCEVVDEYTARIVFAGPYAPFLGAASQVYLAIASPAALAQWGEDYQFHQVGTGPFTFQEYIPRDRVTLQRNPDYEWAPSFFAHQGPPSLDGIQFSFFVDAATRSPALESGQVHVMGEIPPVDATPLRDDSQFEIITVPVPGLSLQFYLNTARAPTDDLRVRQALLYAVDRQLIVDIVFLGFSPPAYGPLTRSTWAYTSSVETRYLPDPDRARALLEEGGWVDGDGDGIRERDGQRLVLDVILTSWGFVPEVGQVLEQQLEAVGVDLNTQLIAAYPTLVETAAAGEYHMIPFTLSSNDPHILRSVFHSSNVEGGFSWSKMQDAELDRLLDTGMRTMDREERAAIYAQAQERIMQLALIVPIRDYVNLNGASATVEGLRFDAQGWFPWLYDVEIK